MIEGFEQLVDNTLDQPLIICCLGAGRQNTGGPSTQITNIHLRGQGMFGVENEHENTPGMSGLRVFAES